MIASVHQDVLPFIGIGFIFRLKENVCLGSFTVKINEFKDIDQPIEHILKTVQLESIINTSLIDNGITTPFTYAVLHEGEIVTEFASEGFVLGQNNFNVSLFKHNLFDKSAQLSINFKGKKSYILKSKNSVKKRKRPNKS